MVKVNVRNLTDTLNATTGNIFRTQNALRNYVPSPGKLSPAELTDDMKANMRIQQYALDQINPQDIASQLSAARSKTAAAINQMASFHNANKTEQLLSKVKDNVDSFTSTPRPQIFEQAAGTSEKYPILASPVSPSVSPGGVLLPNKAEVDHFSRLRNVNTQPDPEELALKNGFNLNRSGQIISPSGKASANANRLSQADIERAQVQYRNNLGRNIEANGSAAAESQLQRDVLYGKSSKDIDAAMVEDAWRNDPEIKKAINANLIGESQLNLYERTKVLQEENAIRNSKEFQDIIQANIAEENRLETIRERQMSMLQRNQAERTRRAEALKVGDEQSKKLREAREEWNLDAAAKEESDLRNSAAFQMAQKRQQALETGSGKSVQDAANSAAAADTSGGPVDMTIDRAMLRQKMGGDKTTWGRKNAEDYQLDNVIKKLEDQQLAIAQNKKFTPEQRLAEWNKHKKEAEDILAEGPGFGDYFFGNKLHYGIGGTAFAAAVGSQAFGGHKSNAELYSSPF